ncbi:hypothetical protein Misp02_35610 [Microtetraspora sp. NBRC 16547]|nr:hypothetical protein Misp02_35610 [Microtetraspora sp. NBRC 16547]
MRPRLVQLAGVLYGGIAALVSGLAPAGIIVVSPSPASVLSSGAVSPSPSSRSRRDRGRQGAAPQTRGLRRRTTISRYRPA